MTEADTHFEVSLLFSHGLAVAFFFELLKCIGGTVMKCHFPAGKILLTFKSKILS